MRRKLSDGGVVSAGVALLAAALPAFGRGRLPRTDSEWRAVAGGCLSWGVQRRVGFWLPGCSMTMKEHVAK
jgi:hypothetical protein